MPSKPNKQVWQDALSDLITDPKELLEIVEIDTSYLKDAYQAARLFPLRVTRSYVERMEKGNVKDPLLLQVLPLGLETKVVEGYGPDPLQEKEANPISGLLHKYHGRVLVTLTSMCAIHCRYCFRRHFPYSENNPGKKGWESIFSYVAADPSISEVILSGGDPLAVSDSMLQAFIEGITEITHVKRLRIHTRLPIVLPERITSRLLQLFSSTSLEVVMVVHANHANEISLGVKESLGGLKKVGVTLLNQSVLLKNINDSVESLCELSESLFSCGVIPYYLHVLDKVQGAAHFDLGENEAQNLYSAMVQRLPGYLVPRLAREEAGKPSKTLLSTALYTG